MEISLCFNNYNIYAFFSFFNKPVSYNSKYYWIFQNTEYKKY